MRIYQVTPYFALGDGVCNHIMSIDGIIRGLGYRTGIHASGVSQNVPAPQRSEILAVPSVDAGDVVICHHSIGSQMANWFVSLPCRKILVYHNITPPNYFEGVNRRLADLTRLGLAQTARMLACADAVWADSDFNRRDILKMGYGGEVFVLPILIRFSDYDEDPDREALNLFRDGMYNILFVGRIAPNKKQEDLIAAFAHYQKNIDANSRLTLVGAFEPNDPYAHRLMSYARALCLFDVCFTGHVRFDRLLAHYQSADCFLCLSEHEGFCIPLLEAMHFDVPVLAFAAGAVEDTLGGSGMLLRQKDPAYVAMAIDRVKRDAALRQGLVASQRRRLADFAFDTVAERYRDAIRHFVEAGL